MKKELLRRFQFSILMCCKSNKQVLESDIISLKDYYYNDKPFFKQEVNINIQYDLMIVIPVYNVSGYLKQCIDSLINQKTQYSYCMILVNDGSTDDSFDILKQYEDKNHIIIKNKENGGISSARNFGLKDIYGKYIMFVDSDDYIPEDCVENLMKIAMENDCDIVEGGYTTFNNEGIIEVKKHQDGMLVSNEKIYGYPWGKVIKSKYFYDLIFPEHFNFEDSIIKTLLVPVCNRKYTISKNVYNYRINDNSITHFLKEKKEALDSFYLMKYIIKEQKFRNIDTGIDEYIYFLNQIRLNYLRIIGLPEYIQKTIFYLSCDIYKTYFKGDYSLKSKALLKTQKVLDNRNYKAYKLLMKNWYYFN